MDADVYVKPYGFLKKPPPNLYVYHYMYVYIKIYLYLDQRETELWLRCLSLQVYMMLELRKCLIKLKMIGLASNKPASDGG